MRSTDSAPPLRADSTSFVGRRIELAEAQALLRKCRLLTLVGPGGIGKTRLAFQVAGQLARTFPDGVYTVELGDSDGHEMVVAQFATVLGVRCTVDAVLDRLRAMSTLLIVDTCEHVVEACGALIREILLAAPLVRVLATSRRSLGVEGEHLQQVNPLPIPATIADARVEDQDAVTLLLHRVSAAAPDFEQGHESRTAILEICRMLDGVPLALEFVAAWFRVLSAEDIVRELSGSARLCGGPGRPERQRTLAASVAWSRRLCAPAERALADHLSVFRDGFTFQAAAEVARTAGVDRDDELLRLVAGLVDKSVIVRDPDQRIARYRILESARKSGESELAVSGKLEQVRRAHRDHFLRLAEPFKAAWSGPGQPADVVAVVRERANVVAALEYSFGDPAQAGVGARLAVLLERFWLNCGFTSEGRRWAGKAAVVAEVSDGDRALASGIYSLTACRSGDHQNGIHFAEKAVRLARRSNDDEVLASALKLAGTTASLADRHTLALEHLAEAGGLTIDANPTLAIATLFAGDVDRAVELARTSLSRAEHWQRGDALYALALCEWRTGKYEQATAHAVDSIQIMHRFGDVVGLAALVELMFWIIASSGAGHTAGRLLGVAGNMWRFAGCEVMFGSRTRLEPHHECVARTRDLLDETDLRSCFSAGLAASSSVDDGVSFITRGLMAAAEDVSPSVLTDRELQIAKLVADGAANKEIASMLTISPRTVATHVGNILKRLGFNSRVQIVTWMAQRTGTRTT